MPHLINDCFRLKWDYDGGDMFPKILHSVFYIGLKACACALVILGSNISQAADWPQWLGPDRASVWHEDGIVDSFPAIGLKTLWRLPVGLGYSGPSVADGKVYLFDYVKKGGQLENNPSGKNLLEGSERLLCLDAATGAKVWEYEYTQYYNLSYAAGPRSTPTVHEGKVYILGAEGRLSCLSTKDGKLIWQKDFKKEYDVETPIWGFSSHPLAKGDTLYSLVGGGGSIMVAFDANTGKEKWRALSAPEPGYGPPTWIEHGGTSQVLIWHPESLNSLNPITGESYWSIPLKPGYNLSIAAPRLYEDSLFVSAIGNVGAMIQLDPSKPGAKIAWRGNARNALYSVNVTPFIENGVIYGCDVESSAFMAVRLHDGKRLWETKSPTIGEENSGRHGTAFVVKHGKRYFLFSETGDLILAELTPESYREISRAHLLEPTNEAFGRDVVWSHPAFANQKVYVRNDKEIICVTLAKADY
jgi:outer membrane protein assembly factor BamB